jgi:hypothetical protein
MFIRLDKKGGVRKKSIAPSIMASQNTTGYAKLLAKTRLQKKPSLCLFY